MKTRALVLPVFALAMTSGVALAAQPPPSAFTQAASCAAGRSEVKEEI